MSAPHPRACLVATLLVVLLAGAADATDRSHRTESLEDIERQIRESEERLERLDAEIGTSRALKRSLEAAVASSEALVGERRARIDGLEDEIARYEARLERLEEEVSRAHEDMALRRERLARTLREAQLVDAGSGLAVLLGHDDPALADRLAVYADHLLDAQRGVLEREGAALARIERARRTALKDRNWLEHIKRKASAQRDAHAAEREERRRRLDAIDSELAEKARSAAALAADRERLERLMAELEALQSSRSGYFEAGRGEYPLPVAGTVAARFGEAKADGRLTWKGLFVTAAEGAPVRAVADGEVVYADRLRGFGLLVVIDHGDEFMTLYGGNRDVTRTPGEWVEAGATIATVGEGSGQRGSGVYFEIRHRAEPLDPEPWLDTAARAAVAERGGGRSGRRRRPYRKLVRLVGRIPPARGPGRHARPLQGR